MNHPTVWKLAIAGAMTLSLTACGYHRIGNATMPVQEEVVSRPTPQRVVPKKDETFQAPAAYFPTQAGTTYTYSRAYAQEGAAGTRVMTVDSDAVVSNRLEMGGDATAMAYNGRVTQPNRQLKVVLPSYAGVHTLQSFLIKDGLKAKDAWDADLDGRYWSFAVKKPERVTVPAGTYDCLVIEAVNRTAAIGAVTITKQTLYFAANVGLVKVVVKVDEQREKDVASHELTEALTSISTK